MTDTTAMNLILMGPPGSGKGTQGAILAKHYGIPHISTGDIIRDNISLGTPMGLDMKRLIDVGEFVPDYIVNKMVEDRLAEQDTQAGFILDGYPRTLQQVEELASMLDADGRDITAVLLMDVPTEETVTRLLLRAGQQRRADDTEDVIRHRIDVYEELTAPILQEYTRQGLLVRIDGVGEIWKVTEDVLYYLS